MLGPVDNHPMGVEVREGIKPERASRLQSMVERLILDGQDTTAAAF